MPRINQPLKRPARRRISRTIDLPSFGASFGPEPIPQHSTHTTLVSPPKNAQPHSPTPALQLPRQIFLPLLFSAPSGYSRPLLQQPHQSQPIARRFAVGTQLQQKCIGFDDPAERVESARCSWESTVECLCDLAV